ncbi:threonine aldolase family protein [Sediminibacillus albus]|uniref:L-threonine aldolase n=1 Tax=Sediminibacillus albus TaxID=407036 RepID=A0A1G8X539_9BACI|nr:beta-eliminating lyase-related protein [Sediminibacillus albus]SDJ85554.1 L-threonine aldolase [Sediminibacillus albus]
MNNSLAEAFKHATYYLSGHSKRNVRVLKQALTAIDDEQASDMYGRGEVIENFQAKMANYLGKEAAVFFPSGTMAQQIALRIWCDKKGIKRVAYHPLSHLEIHEEDGLKKLHQIETILIADETRVIELEDVVSLGKDIACLLLELPQREIGGQLPEYQTLEAISTYCGDNNIKLHLDGARLLEILPFYQKSAAEICGLFDSVYLSFYKGIGGIAGAILAGDQVFTEQSKIWKRRHGGDIISLYPYIISADHYFEQRKDNMAEYYHQAKELALAFNDCRKSATTPVMPTSNMFHVHFSAAREKLEPILSSICLETGIGITGYLKSTSNQTCSFEVSIGDRYQQIPKDLLQKGFKLLDERLGKIE